MLAQRMMRTDAIPQGMALYPARETPKRNWLTTRPTSRMVRVPITITLKLWNGLRQADHASGSRGERLIHRNGYL